MSSADLNLVVQPSPPLSVQIEEDAAVVTVSVPPQPAAVTVSVPGPQGERGEPGESPATGDKSYTHQQSVAALVWTVVHNLGKYPSGVLLDTAGEEWNSRIVHDSLNQLRVVNTAPFAGTYTCN